MINRLLLGENAYFYKVIQPLSNALIDRILIEAAKKRTGNYVHKSVRQSHVVNGVTYIVSLAIFKYETPPTFLTTGTEKEIKYGYLLVVEHSDYLVISKRATWEFMDLLDSNIAAFEYSTLAKFRVTARTQFRKMSVSNLDTSANSLRRASYEADDVKRVLNGLATSNKVVGSLKVKNASTNTTIAINQSRVNDLGLKVPIDPFISWASKVCDQLGSYTPSKNFLDNFATQLNYQKEIANYLPISVMFNFSSIIDEYESGEITSIYYDSSHGRRELDIRQIAEAHDFCFDLAYDGTINGYLVNSSIDNSLVLKVRTNQMAFESDKLNKIYIQYAAGALISLLQLINKECLFIVAFDNVEVRYTARTLFRDSRLLGHLPHFLKIIVPDKALNAATSEKGNILSTSTAFDTTSEFHIVEASLSKDCDYLFCDDLGDEWADYIGFKKDVFIRLYHVKHSKKSYSASAFHDVISQALKNIGNFNFNQDLTAKAARFKKNYSGTGIPRLRKGSSLKQAMSDLRTTFNNPNIQRELVLVVNFLTKPELVKELTALKKGAAKKQTIQILWLLSAFVAACLERGIVAKIITKE